MGCLEHRPRGACSRCSHGQRMLRMVCVLVWCSSVRQPGLLLVVAGIAHRVAPPPSHPHSPCAHRLHNSVVCLLRRPLVCSHRGRCVHVPLLTRRSAVRASSRNGREAQWTNEKRTTQPAAGGHSHLLAVVEVRRTTQAATTRRGLSSRHACTQHTWGPPARGASTVEHSGRGASQTTARQQARMQACDESDPARASEGA